MIKYTIAMSIRVACIFAMLFAQGWWLVVFAAGAIFLPYVAVVLANVNGPTRSAEVLRPGGLVPVTPPVSGPAEGEGADDTDAASDATHASDATNTDATGAPDATGSDTDAGTPPHDGRDAA